MISTVAVSAFPTSTIVTVMDPGGHTVAGRLHLGWDLDRALAEPLWSPNKARRNPILVVYQGRQMPLADACRLAGLPYATVAARLRAGVEPVTALSKPVRRAGA